MCTFGFIYGNGAVFSLHSGVCLFFFYLSIFLFVLILDSFPLSIHFDKRYFLLFSNFICFICQMQMIFCIHFAHSLARSHSSLRRVQHLDDKILIYYHYILYTPLCVINFYVLHLRHSVSLRSQFILYTCIIFTCPFLI